MSNPFFMVCKLCGYKAEAVVGPEMYSEAKRRLIEHVNEHSDQELLKYARAVLTGGIGYRYD